MALFMLDKVLRVARLFDFYGALLTQRQRQCLELHYLQDLSLAEIAEEFSVSRQAIHDILRRSEQILEEYEAKLTLVERYQSERQALSEIYSLLVQLPEECGAWPQIDRAVERLRALLTEEKET